MGTRTYSRRRADGTRVLTRMGRERAQGSFVEGMRQAGLAENRASIVGNDKEAYDSLKANIRGMLRKLMPMYVGAGSYPKSDRGIRGLLTPVSASDKKKIQNEYEARRIKNILFRGDRELDQRFKGIRDAMMNGDIGVNNGTRILDSAEKARGIISDYINQALEQVGEVNRDGERLFPEGFDAREFNFNMFRTIADVAEVASATSRLYDQLQTVPPEATRLRREIEAQIKTMNNQVRQRLETTINGEFRRLGLPQQPMSQVSGGRSPKSAAQDIYQTMMGNLLPVFYRSSEKYARENSGIINQVAKANRHILRRADGVNERSRRKAGNPAPRSVLEG